MKDTHAKQIDCPAHPGKHWAALYCYPSEFAGIWECPVTGASDAHDHHEDPDVEIEVEDTVSDHMGFQGHYQTEGQQYVCGGKNGCGEALEGDPEYDKYEASLDL